MERVFGLYNRSNERDFQQDLFIETGLYAEVCDHGDDGACVHLFNDANEIVDRLHFTHKRDAVNALRIAGLAARIAGAENAPEPVLRVGEALMSPTPINIDVHIHNSPIDAQTIEQILSETLRRGKPAA